MKYFRLAADQDNAHAQYSLGVFYEKGVGVDQDLREAVKLYRLSADQGNPNAQALVVVMKMG